MTGGIFITGTDTGVGKTWVAVQLIGALREQGFAVCPKKPVESGLAECATTAETDGGQLAAAAGVELDDVVRYRLQRPLAPPVAAAIEGVVYTMADCVAACRHTEGIALIEGAGGWRSPLAADGDVADLAVALGYPVLVVAADRLGAINQTILTCEAIARTPCPLVGVVLNQQDAAENDFGNAQSLRAALDVPVWCTGPATWLDAADAYNLITQIAPQPT